MVNTELNFSRKSVDNSFALPLEQPQTKLLNTVLDCRRRPRLIPPIQKFPATALPPPQTPLAWRAYDTLWLIIWPNQHLVAFASSDRIIRRCMQWHRAYMYTVISWQRVVRYTVIHWHRADNLCTLIQWQRADMYSDTMAEG